MIILKIAVVMFFIYYVAKEMNQTLLKENEELKKKLEEYK